VLIVSIDTLRADHLGCYGYAPYTEPVSPRIDQFAKESLRFERCFAPRGQTGPSLTAMLTGCYPSRHGVLDNFVAMAPDTTSLPQMLAAAGYESHAFLAWYPILRADKERLGFGGAKGRGGAVAGSFFEARPTMKSERESRWDDAAEQAFVEFVRKRPRDARPFFAWVHFYDVHQPYAPPAPYDEKFVGDYRGRLRMPSNASEADFDRIVREPGLDASMKSRRPLDPADAKYVVALYDGGVACADARFGRVLDALAASGLANDTVVVLTADHGDELGEHRGLWFHGNSVYDSVLRIPLIVRAPGKAKGRSDQLVQNVDLAPTLLDLLGRPKPSGIDGISFEPWLEPSVGIDSPASGLVGRGVAWSEWQNLVLGARTDQWKLVLNPKGARLKKPPFDGPREAGFSIGCHELYDVRADVHELDDVWKAKRGEPDVAALLAQVEAEYARRFASLVPASAPLVADPAERQRLAQLGYGNASGEAADYTLDPEACADDK
jgi:arylsulfatase A-like enzyme